MRRVKRLNRDVPARLRRLGHGTRRHQTVTSRLQVQNRDFKRSRLRPYIDGNYRPEPRTQYRRLHLGQGVSLHEAQSWRRKSAKEHRANDWRWWKGRRHRRQAA
jgi:hypothetical protein